MSIVKEKDKKIYDIIQSELNRQNNYLELIASENFTSKAVLETAGSVLTNKYAEGYPGKRYYGGCIHVDEAENLAIDRAKRLFKAEYANVQPHSGSSGNMGVYLAYLQPGDCIMGLDLSHGGHLTHGSKVSFSGQIYNSVTFQVKRDTGLVDFDDLLKKAREYKPKIIICGASAYPRTVEFEKFREVADEVGAFLHGDICHNSGLIAAEMHPSPFPHCHVVSTSTHKSLRGPRGGIILLGSDYENPFGKVAPKSGRVKMMSELIDSAVMPGIQGGPLMHIIAAKAVAFKEALEPSFKTYIRGVLDNAQCFAEEFKSKGYELVSGGTDTHLVLIDLQNKNISGKAAEIALDEAGITVNKNMIPFDPKSPFVTSGIRIGSPAMTTRGMGVDEAKIIVDLIDQVILNHDNKEKIQSVKKHVNELCSSFQIYD
ncbi:MAG: serine hydroxymethyltransferase [Candidatus Marinimicrobia bacterium]|nr:serine hydroxymethyltransferase [Candidatus Neomarinimicrobiota bacterium]MBL6826662.1 serine hydroxymethyltransferase [Candidatus Neomarinimicrobiota bacterium]MDA0753680.1 serine hydroxymethyltransferase [Candidatus Neomarinimicrobiota bacterium]MDA1363711.1 serine hydroxymethyltransferase [Candidatus Neomarinimicrobiota bacterium]